MCVMAGEKTSRQDLTGHVGIRSSEHEALDDELTSLQISSTGKGEKPSNCATGGGVSELGGLTEMLLIQSLMTWRRMAIVCRTYTCFLA